MHKIYFRERHSQSLVEEKIYDDIEEKVYGKGPLSLLYGANPFLKIASKPFLIFITRLPFFSILYGWLQKSSFSRNKIKRFIRNYNVQEKEFADPVDSYKSFNDFFIRKLKASSRPIANGSDIAILPADGRYLVFPKVNELNHIFVKGKKFSLNNLFRDELLTKQYQEGSLVMARLCPTDYHRYHFPFDCIPSESKLINGPLFSVNPIALKTSLSILSENKRVITTLESLVFGKVLFIEVGATNVGSICNTFTPNHAASKGNEKGYFEFGGSCLLLFFPKNSIIFDTDLIKNTESSIETRGLMGQSLGKVKAH